MPAFKTGIFNNYKIPVLYTSLFLILCVLCIWSLTLGPVALHPEQLNACLLHHQDNSGCRIILESRLPRTIAGIISGGGFALSGVILLYITRNPLACPSLLGINQGAQLGILLMLVLIPMSNLPLLITSSIIGGLLSGLIIYVIVVASGTSALKLVLTGQVINALLYAIAQALLILLPKRTGGTLISLNGSLAGISWTQLQDICPWLLITIIAALFLIRKIHILSLGEEIALSLGLNVNLILALGFILIIILCSLSVSIVGQLLFFPLIAVHLSKLLFNAKNPYHLGILAILNGSILMLLSDCLMRFTYTVEEVPLGIFMACIGAPVLILSSRLKNN